VWTILLAVVVLASLLLLAASLNALELADGKPLPLSQMTPDLSSPGGTGDLSRIIMAIMRVGLIIAWVLVPFYVIYLIISKEARKRFIRDMMTLLPILLLLYWLTSSGVMRNQGEELSGRFGLDNQMEEGLAEEPPPMPEFQPPPAWVTTVTSLALAAAVTAIVAVTVYAIWRRTRRKEDRPLRKIERGAQDALDALAAGGDLREVIQRCYFQMIEALSQYRNIQRGRDVTPHEFEMLLQGRGLPADPVHQLTALFEQVRYGAHQPGRQEERLAVSSLSAIVTACQRARDAEARL
jgi:hypothetical protein